MRPSVRFNPAELDALKGLPLAARVLYVEGIRPFMDYATGVVGASNSPDKSISLQSLSEVLYVEPRQGRTDSGSRSRRQAKVCIKTLIEAGLLASMSIVNQHEKRLILKCVLADTDHSVQKKQVSNVSHKQVSNVSQGETSNGNGLAQESATNHVTPETTKHVTPPETGLTDNTITRARTLQSISESFDIDSAVEAYLVLTPVPRKFCVELVDEFRLANMANGYQSMNWPAEFAKYCVKQWRYQQSFENRNQRRPDGPQSKTSVHHASVEDKDYLDGADGFVTRRH